MLKEILDYEIECNHCHEYTSAKEKCCRHCGAHITVPMEKNLWFILLMLLTLFPVGAYYLYKHDGFTENAKIYMAAACLLVSVCLYTNYQQQPKHIASQKQEITASTQSISDSVDKAMETQEQKASKKPAPAVAPTQEKPKQESKETPQPRKAIQQTCLGNANSGKFHRPSCRTIKNKDASHFIQFSLREEAVEAGYVPCQVCCP